MKAARRKCLTYLARYAPGAPVTYLLTLSYGELVAFHREVSDLVGEEQKK